jgi:hypothetical protein
LGKRRFAYADYSPYFDLMRKLGKDPIRQNDTADKPYGSPRQLNIDTIDRNSDAARKLPKDEK